MCARPEGFLVESYAWDTDRQGGVFRVSMVTICVDNKGVVKQKYRVSQNRNQILRTWQASEGLKEVGQGISSRSW